jgi:uncharacterized LabA/DUF88 family protein
VSKNVAVFVDVANIFYAAKAAGVDIDYVTLLKAATAGRDFVRAYAYTGLDPDNDNQRQFHSFLSRSGYKVVSKDIRKYGDGRIKANLDIELVVDMMRMANHIDIAVVVSGDGDFAPAIRAVQQQGVRVEVVSFRGNTSSDLVEVADVFTDISQVARVEKGARSGRRVAQADDLSMTEVPEKETDLGPRRRRGERRGTGEREERAASRSRASAAAAAAAPDAALPGNLIVLPGERLSRAADVEEELAGADEQERVEADADIETATDGDGGRRRRRRRGGRGRGRGRSQELEGAPTELVSIAGEDEELLEEELAPLPQHSTFGSVWDTQMGVPSAPRPAASFDDEDVGDEDEPEIPEYLLAERRQQTRGRGRGGQRQGRGGGYRAAVDRERFGRSGSSVFGGGPRMPDRGRGGHGGPRPNQPPQRPPRQAPEPRRESNGPAPTAEPWSEVPLEVQELLRAELARRQAPDRRPVPSREPAELVDDRSSADAAPLDATAEPAAPARGRRTQRAARDAAPEPATAEAVPAATTRRRTTRSPAAAEEPAAAASSADAAAPRRGRRTTKPAAEAEPAEAVSEAKPKARRTSKAKVSTDTADASESATSETAEAPKPRRRTTRGKAPTGDESPAAG